MIDQRYCFFEEMYLLLFLAPLVLESDLSRRLHNGILIFSFVGIVKESESCDQSVVSEGTQ